MFHIFSKKKTFVGLDIENDYIRFVKIFSNKNNEKVESYGEFTFDVSPFKNGLIESESLLLESFKKIKEDVKVSNLFVSLPLDQFRYFNFIFSSLKDKRDLKYQLENYLRSKNHMTFDEQIFYFTVKKINKEKDNYSVFIANKILINKYKEIFKKVGFVPKSFIHKDQALINGCIPKNTESSFLVVCLEKDISYILLYLKNKEKMFYTVPSDKRAIVEVVNKAYIEWYEKMNKKVDHAFIVGGGAKDEFLVDYISSATKINFVKGNIFTNRNINLDKVPVITKNDSLKFAIATGSID